MRFIIFSLALVPFIWATQSCKTSNEVDLYPCDTTNISFQDDIVPILETKCYKCHSDANATQFGENVDLEGYADLKSWADWEPNGSKSILLANVQHDLSNVEHTAMPKGDPKLPQCEIDKIEAWINQGKLDN